MDDKQLVVLKLADQENGVPIHQVREIIRYKKTVKVPDTPIFLEPPYTEPFEWWCGSSATQIMGGLLPDCVS